jgi:hypothetical protein
VGVAVCLLGMLVTVLTMLVSRRGMLLGFLMLPMRVMVGRLQVVVCGGVMVCGGLMVMIHGRVFGLLWHRCCLLRGMGNNRRSARNDRPSVVGRYTRHEECGNCGTTPSWFLSCRYRIGSAAFASSTLHVALGQHARCALERINSCSCERLAAGTHPCLRLIRCSVSRLDAIPGANLARRVPTESGENTIPNGCSSNDRLDWRSPRGSRLSRPEPDPEIIGQVRHSSLTGQVSQCKSGAGLSQEFHMVRLPSALEVLQQLPSSKCRESFERVSDHVGMDLLGRIEPKRPPLVPGR